MHILRWDYCNCIVSSVLILRFEQVVLTRYLNIQRDREIHTMFVGYID